MLKVQFKDLDLDPDTREDLGNNRRLAFVNADSEPFPGRLRGINFIQDYSQKDTAHGHMTISFSSPWEGEENLESPLKHAVTILETHAEKTGMRWRNVNSGKSSKSTRPGERSFIDTTTYEFSNVLLAELFKIVTALSPLQQSARVLEPEEVAQIIQGTMDSKWIKTKADFEAFGFKFDAKTGKMNSIAATFPDIGEISGRVGALTAFSGMCMKENTPSTNTAVTTSITCNDSCSKKLRSIQALDERSDSLYRAEGSMREIQRHLNSAGIYIPALLVTKIRDELAAELAKTVAAADTAASGSAVGEAHKARDQPGQQP